MDFFWKLLTSANWFRIKCVRVYTLCVATLTKSIPFYSIAISGYGKANDIYIDTVTSILVSKLCHISSSNITTCRHDRQQIKQCFEDVWSDYSASCHDIHHRYEALLFRVEILNYINKCDVPWFYLYFKIFHTLINDYVHIPICTYEWPGKAYHRPPFYYISARVTSRDK